VRYELLTFDCLALDIGLVASWLYCCVKCMPLCVRACGCFNLLQLLIARCTVQIITGYKLFFTRRICMPNDRPTLSLDSAYSIENSPGASVYWGMRGFIVGAKSDD
jgi:hypothetical protein